MKSCLFMQIYERFKPVLHHWFLEAFRQPSLWFERRLSFTRSTAVNSMAGQCCCLPEQIDEQQCSRPASCLRQLQCAFPGGLPACSPHLWVSLTSFVEAAACS